MNALVVVLHHITLIDGTGAEPMPDATVAFRDGSFIYAGKARTWLPSLQEDILNMDFTGKFVLPGLIDCHVQLARGGEPHGRIDGDDGVVALRILNNARRNLAGGITTVRDLGGWDGVEFAVRESIHRGDFCGPRLVLSGRCITSSDAALQQHAGRYRVAKGPDEVRKAAREQLRRGADWIELAMTGSLLVQDDVPVTTLLSPEECGAAVEEAAVAGKHVAAHAHGIEGIRQAVLAGATTIEHATFLHKGRDVIDEMLKRGTFMVPTLNAGRVIAEGGTSRVPDWMVERLNDTYESARKSTRLAHQAGVAVAMGSNAGTPLNRHGENALGVMSIQQAGLKPMEALVSATLTAARALGRDSQLGTIQEGKLADLLVLDSDPLEDLSRLADKKQLRAVFLDGKLVARQATDSYPRIVLNRDCLLIGQ
ncbi:MAG TPA: amidohydrolase family protein [Anaerolineales bacterium]|nr:amidohydrolase family protein [Anaerolineales bacterium]